MTVAGVAFYIFSIVMLTGGAFTVVSKNPVHSVLWLILTFLSASGLFVLLGAEFVAMLLIIVYVGAVMVLFLFVVMMLDIDFAALKAGMAKYLPFAILIGVVVLMQMSLAYGDWHSAEGVAIAGSLGEIAAPEVHNTAAIGQIMYTEYLLLFQLAGLVLLVSMIGAIVLTLRHRSDVKRQNVLTQMYRDPTTETELQDIKPGQGL